MSTPSATGVAVAPRRVRRREELRDRRSAVMAWVRTGIVAVAGVLGVVALLVWLAPLAGIHLVSLATGSMAPTYPAGAILLVRDVPAASVGIGDVVTLTRADGASVTHRVSGVETTAGGGGVTTTALTLRGDANPVDDRDPYLADRVGLVVAGLPVGGPVLVGLREPGVGIVLAVLVSLLVLWTWWPSRRETVSP
jgi:signal peptidase